MPYSDWTTIRRNLFDDPQVNTVTNPPWYPQTGAVAQVGGANRFTQTASGDQRIGALCQLTPSTLHTVRARVRGSLARSSWQLVYRHTAPGGSTPTIASGQTISDTVDTEFEFTFTTGSGASGATSGVYFINASGNASELLDVIALEIEVGDTTGQGYIGAPTSADLERVIFESTNDASDTLYQTRTWTAPVALPKKERLKPSDLLVEFRDKDLVRQGSIPIDDLRLKMQPVFNGVGSWAIQLPSEHRAVPYMRTPGAGIIVTNLKTGETLLSGPTSKPSKKKTIADVKGTTTIAGLTDDRLLWDARAFADPAQTIPEDATTANDVRSGQASQLMRVYVNRNIGAGSPAGRRGTSLRNKITLGPDPALGPVTTRRPRYDILGDLLYGIGLEANLGFRLVQVGDHLQFQVYQPTDRSAFIRLDVTNGTLQDQIVEFAPPEVTRMIVAGHGEGVERQMLLMSTAESTQAEEDWGLIIEEFKDQRNTGDEEELEAAGLERLNEAGFTKVAVKATPSNDQTMIFMTDFFLGDKVGIVIDDQEQPSTIITEAAIVLDNTGLRTAVAIGDVADFDSDSALRQQMADTQKRVSNLEQNLEVAAPVNQAALTTGLAKLVGLGLTTAEARAIAGLPA